MGPTQVNHKRNLLTKQLGQMLMRSARSWDKRHMIYEANVNAPFFALGAENLKYAACKPAA